MRHPNHRFLILALSATIAACSDPGPRAGNQSAANGDPATAPASDFEPVAEPTTMPAATEPEESADVVPVRFQGRYAADGAACDAAGHESRLQIDAGRIAFHESSGVVTSVAGGGDEVTIQANVTGEGETREASWTFRLDAEGDTLTDVAAGMSRQRCG